MVSDLESINFWKDVISPNRDDWKEEGLVKHAATTRSPLNQDDDIGKSEIAYCITLQGSDMQDINQMLRR